MAKQTNTHNKKQLQNKSDDWVVIKVLAAFVLLILSLVALHRIGQYYVTSEGFDVVYPGSLRWFWILVPLVVLGVAVPFFWKKPLVRELGSYVAVLSALGAVSAILFRLHWTDDLHFLYFLHALVYCLYMIFLLYRAEFFLVSLATGLAGGVFYTYYHGVSVSFRTIFSGALLVLVIALTAALANVAGRHGGVLPLGKKKLRIFPNGFSPLFLYIICAVWLVCLIASLLLGSLFSYYCMFAAIAIELIAAVYYTFQLK